MCREKLHSLFLTHVPWASRLPAGVAAMDCRAPLARVTNPLRAAAVALTRSRGVPRSRAQLESENGHVQGQPRLHVIELHTERSSDRKDELAALITGEHGKVSDDALGEASRGIEVIEFACGIPHLLS